MAALQFCSELDKVWPEMHSLLAFIDLQAPLAKSIPTPPLYKQRSFFCIWSRYTIWKKDVCFTQKKIISWIKFIPNCEIAYL